MVTYSRKFSLINGESLEIGNAQEDYIYFLVTN